jgi:NADH oxidase (H2O2-forming)
MEVLEHNGINIRCDEKIEAVLGKKRVEGLVTTTGELECDTLIWAVGMRPKVDLAKKAGIELGDKGGIKVNSHMETNIPGIYACGDCVETKDILTGEQSLNLLWSNANRQGSIVGHNITGISLDYPGSYKILNLDVFGKYVSGFGYTEASVSRLKEIDTIGNKLSDVSVIECERNGSYYRLVVVGDRCIGGQFINLEKGLGMLWSTMFRRKSIKELIKLFDNETLICRRPWYRYIKPFFPRIKENEKLYNV